MSVSPRRTRNDCLGSFSGRHFPAYGGHYAAFWRYGIRYFASGKSSHVFTAPLLDPPKNRQPLRTIGLVAASIILVLNLVVALVTSYGESATETAGFFYANMGVFLVLFVILALPSQFWPKTKKGVTVLWVVVIAFSVATVGIACGSIAELVPNLTGKEK